MIKKLEAIRGFAALYVFIHHLIGFTDIKDKISPMLRFPFRFGQEGVIVFFLLSGFVIYYSNYTKQDTFIQYIKKRLTRIYPIFFVSLIISWIVFYLNGNNWYAIDFSNLIGNLLLLQDIQNKPGISITVFLENHALWSLSYEWFFYILYFPLIKLLNGYKNRIYIVLLISLLSWCSYLLYPNHFSLVLSYLIIWWIGVECAMLYLRNDFRWISLMPSIICLVTMTMFSCIPILNQIRNNTFIFNQIMYPVLTARHFGSALLFIVVGKCWWDLGLLGFNVFFGYFEKLSKISYGLYIIHIPIIHLNMEYVGFGTALLYKVIIIFTLAFFLETILQPFARKLFYP